MSKHSKIGQQGEQIAADFLLNKGYNIIARNWRFKQREIDIIASEKDVLVFVEVKTRTSNHLLNPEETVNRKKQSFLRSAAEAYADENPARYNFRFDIISILMNGESPKEIVHFKEAF